MELPCISVIELNFVPERLPSPPGKEGTGSGTGGPTSAGLSLEFSTGDPSWCPLTSRLWSCPFRSSPFPRSPNMTSSEQKATPTAPHFLSWLPVHKVNPLLCGFLALWAWESLFRPNPQSSQCESLCFQAFCSAGIGKQPKLRSVMNESVSPDTP